MEIFYFMCEIDFLTIDNDEKWWSKVALLNTVSPRFCEVSGEHKIKTSQEPNFDFVISFDFS